MKGKIKPVLGCTVSALAVSMFTSMAVMAASPDAEIENSVWSYRAVANVSTQVNIRANASTDSAIVGYLPKAASADVIEKGPEWSHIISGGVEGYIKNEYLAYGEEAKALAGVYGKQGVKVSWDDVILFSNPNSSSAILNKADGGSEYELISEEGLWCAVQMDDVTVAYVPAEDVQKTTMLERAIPVVTSPETSGYTQTASGGGEAYSQTDTSGDTTASAGAADGSGYDASGDQSGSQDYTDQSSTDQSYTDQGTADSGYTDSSASDNSYTDQSGTSDATSGGENSSTDTSVSDPGSTGSGQTTPSEETVTSANSDDLSLLAALIYCEAGNQSREGKVAVGAVVMNRIASSSYPGTISDVIYQSGQFAPAITGWLGQVLASGAPSDCYEAAQAALNGENPVPGALYFNNSAGKGTKIGDHWFY